MDNVSNAIEIFASKDKIQERLLKYCSEYLGIPESEITPASYLAYLINVLSIEIANLLFYASSLYDEFFLVRAKHRESVLAIAQMFGYDIEFASPATTKVMVMLDLLDIKHNGRILLNGLSYGIKKNNPVEVSDNAGNVFVFKNDIIVETLVDDNNNFINAKIYSVSLDGTVTNIPFFIATYNNNRYLAFFEQMIQIKEVVYHNKIPNLGVNEFYSYYKDIVSGMIHNTYVYTTPDDIDTIIKNGLGPNKQYWTRVPSLFLADKNKHIYTIQQEKNRIKFLFGNGIIGKQPKPNDVVVTCIHLTNGSKGNIEKNIINSETKIKYYYDDNNIGSIYLIINNIERGINGKDYPTIDEIRKKVITNLKSSKRLVTKEDFDNISNIVPELSSSNVIPIVKRTDLKCNEITIYTDLFFNNKLVPTTTQAIVFRYQPGETKRLISKWTVVSGEEKEILNNENIQDNKIYLFTFNKEYNLLSTIYEERSKTLYRTLFDIEVDLSRNDVTYYYYNTNQSLMPTEIYNSYPKNSIKINKLDYYVLNDKVYLDLYILISDMKLFREVMGRLTPIISTTLKTDTGLEIPFEYVSIDVQPLTGINIVQAVYRVEVGQIRDMNEILKCRISIFSNVDEHDLIYSEYAYCNSEWYTEIEVKKTLSNFIRSSCFKYESETLAKNDKNYYMIILDVPLTTNTMYETLMKKSDLELFERYLYEKICNINLDKYKMLTDDISIKFVKTFGILTNINKFNKTTKSYVIHSIDPDNISNIVNCLFDGLTIAITNFEKRKVWDLLYPNTDSKSIMIKNKIKKIVGDKSGFLMTYNEKEDLWVGPIWLDAGDILLYDPTKLPSDDNNITTSQRISPIKLMFNGEKLIPLIFTIPLNISLRVVCKENNYMDKYIVNVVKRHLIERLSSRFGCDKNLYRNEIEKAVEELWFIKNCKVIEPKYDIIFNYNIKNLSYTDLQSYTPELVYFTSNTINVHIVRE